MHGSLQYGGPCQSRNLSSLRGAAPLHSTPCRPSAQRREKLIVNASGSTYGTAFRVTTFGESHGKGVGCVVDGVPPRLRITEAEIQVDLDRRRPGQSIITTPRKEDDVAEILSGVYDGVTLGTPIAIMIRNKDQKSADYSEMSVAYRPSHADATYDFKYGIRAVAGGGRSSARETIGRVAAGAIAKKLLHVVGGTEVGAATMGWRGVTEGGTWGGLGGGPDHRHAHGQYLQHSSIFNLVRLPPGTLYLLTSSQPPDHLILYVRVTFAIPTASKCKSKFR